MLNVKKLRNFYIIALSIIAVLMLMTYFVMINAISTQSYDATIIKVGSKQAMLSQRVALLTTQLLFPEKREWAHAELTKAVTILKSSHLGLTKGDNDLALPGIRTDEMRALYYDKRIQYPGGEIEGLISLDEFMLHYIDEIEEVISLKENEMTLNDLLLRHTINDYHDMVLPLLLEIVDQYERESHHNVRVLLYLEKGILITALLVLLLEAVFIFRPIVKHIEARTKMLLQANKHLEIKRHHDRLAALGQLSGGIAHEINNALQPILGLSGIIKIRTKDKDEELYKFATVLENSALHARKIISNVLSFSKQDKDIFETMRAIDVINEACDFSKSLLPAIIRIERDLKLEQHDFLSCDQTAVIQVFVNIIKNAADALNGEGTIIINSYTRFIDTENIPADEYICVDIIDHGRGMKAEILDNIFNPFFTTKGEGKGTGLGLSTAFGIMKRHNGHITVQSVVNEGSKFTLYFPKSSPDDKIRNQGGTEI